MEEILIMKNFGIDYESTLKWVQKKKPNMTLKEQEKFAKNIMAKKARENAMKESAKIYRTYKDVENAVREYQIAHWPEDYENGKTHYKASLKALGFVEDAYDQYGACAYTNGIVRVAVFYDRGDCYWDMEEAQGYSATTDNFYNTSSEMHDMYGVYGRGSYEDPWNLGA